MEDNLPKFENREELLINGEIGADLRKAMSWAKFLSIVMFVGTGMVFLCAIVCFALDPSSWLDSAMLPGMGKILGGLYLVISVVYFFLAYFMYMFANKLRKAVTCGDVTALGCGVRNMKYYFQFYGILTIVALAAVVLMIIIAAAGAAFLSI